MQVHASPCPLRQQILPLLITYIPTAWSAAIFSPLTGYRSLLFSSLVSSVFPTAARGSLLNLQHAASLLCSKPSEDAPSSQSQCQRLTLTLNGPSPSPLVSSREPSKPSLFRSILSTHSDLRAFALAVPSAWPPHKSLPLHICMPPFLPHLLQVFFWFVFCF